MAIINVAGISVDGDTLAGSWDDRAEATFNHVMAAEPFEDFNATLTIRSGGRTMTVVWAKNACHVTTEETETVHHEYDF